LNVTLLSGAFLEKFSEKQVDLKVIAQLINIIDYSGA